MEKPPEADKPFRLDFRVAHFGWADAELVADHQRLQLTASYLTDALPLLLGAVEGILAGAETSEAFWAEEPGCYRWIFTRDGNVLRVRVFVEVGTHRTWPLPSWELPAGAETREGDDDIEFCAFDYTDEVVTIASELARAAAAELHRLGELEYWADWESPFPKDLLWGVEDKLGRARTITPELAPLVDDPWNGAIKQLWGRLLEGSQSPEAVKDELNSHAFATASMTPVAREGARALYVAAMSDHSFDRDRAEHAARFDTWLTEVELYEREPAEWLRRTLMARLAYAVRGTSHQRAVKIARRYREYLGDRDIRTVIKHRDPQMY